MRQPRGAAPTGPDSPTRPRPAHAGPPADERQQPEPGRAPLADRTPAPIQAARALRPLSLRLRPRTVRARIVSLLMVPVVSLMALWGFATVTTAQDVDAVVRLKQVDATLLTPVAAGVDALQAERTAAAQYAAAPSAARADALAARSRATDSALVTLNTDILAGAANNAGLAAALPARLDALMTAADGLPALRQKVTARTLGWSDTMKAYSDTVETSFEVDGALTGVQNTAIASDSRVLLELARARELLAREDATEQSAQAAGRMSAEQYQQFTGALYARQAISDSAAPDLRPVDRAAYLQVAHGPQATALGTLEAAVRSAGPGTGPVRQVADPVWSQTAQNLQQQLEGVEAAAGAGATANADPYSVGVFTKNGAAVLFGLLAVLLSLLISVRIGRGLVVELVGLRNSALDLAGRRLPAAMRRLRAGEEVDVDAEAPVVEAGDDELGQVGEALNTVQRAALHAAVERAEVLSGVSGVFVNLARRSQVLVHRQLTLLDAMERRTEDPAELDDLFRLDHLTTRMRRHAEGLIILSGAAPGRAWRKSVPLLDVVRSAVAEVEDYSRVEVRRLPRASVVGPAVADLTHLIAELVENATGFSPPHTKVLVSGEQVGTGYALEIEDRGLGMGREAVEEANRRIADAQQADLFDSDRLGLFVVSRLARRHNVRVSLRTSPYGGTTVVILLPTALLDSGRAGAGPDDRARRTSTPRTPEPTPVQQHLDEAVQQPVPDFASQFESAGTRGASPFRPPRSTDSLSRRFPLRDQQSAAAGRNGAAFRNGGRGDRPDDPAAAFEPGQESATPPAAVPIPPAPPSPAGSSAAGSSAARPSGSGSGASGPIDDLPRRVRQASIAVQLRDAPAPAAARNRGAAGPGGRGGQAARSPEDARATMSALAEGWARGRTADTAPPQRHLKIQHEREATDGRDDEPLR
ncbi:signal transduction histidine kinase [Streptacidiphilus sp. MAP12-16]|uniref:sensor histidine kinase n=1 Tax=Streptacidiphilus sp. MAP12-16 TaxID=3156300 RepID=UPI00351556FB